MREKRNKSYANVTKQDIARVGEKLPEERFEEIFKEYGIEMKKSEENMMVSFTKITSEAVGGREKGTTERKRLTAALKEISGRLPEEVQDSKDIKNY